MAGKLGRSGGARPVTRPDDKRIQRSPYLRTNERLSFLSADERAEYMALTPRQRVEYALAWLRARRV